MSSKTDAARDAAPLTAAWRAALVAVLAVAAALRVLGLNGQLWFDELATLVVSVRHPLWDILTEFPGVNQHPFYSVLAHAAVGAFGEAPWTLRLPAAVFGVAAVWVVWEAGCDWLGRPVALLAAVLLATSSHHVWFSQNARGYTMLATFTLASTLALLRFGEDGRRRHAVLYVVTAVAGVFTHLTMAFVLVAHVVTVTAAWLLGERAARRFLPAPTLALWTVTAIVCGLAYAAYIPDLIATFVQKAPPQAAQVATASRATRDLLRGVTDGFGVGGLLIALAAGVTGGLRLLRERPLLACLIVMPAVTTLGLTAMLGQPLRPRFLFNVSSGAALVVAFGLWTLAGAIAQRLAGQAPAARAAVAAAAVLVVLAGAAPAIAHNAATPKQDFDGALRLLDATAAAGETVVGAGTLCFVLDSYFGRRWPCVETYDEWIAATAGRDRVVVVHTLLEFWDDPRLITALTRDCRDRARFAGTLAGGDVVVCDAPGARASAP